MNAIALTETDFRTRVRPSEAECLDCGNALRDGEDLRCAGCADLAMHNGECHDCGRILRDQDISRMACMDCLA